MPDDPAPRSLPLVVPAVLVCAVLLLVFTRSAPAPVPVRAATAVGDESCLSCHHEKATFEETAHRRTMRAPSATSIAGSFAPGANVLRTTNPYVHFRMDARDGGFYQSAVFGQSPDTGSHTERIAYVVGSGRKGQSYLYFAGDRLYELPVSYWRSIGAWVNSPGGAYRDGSVNFERAITPRCLDCHTTWMATAPTPPETNRYDSAKAILGVTCERCHASGGEHVARERSALRAVRAPAIVNPARLDRRRKLEACAQCHGGPGTLRGPAFAYLPGRELDRHLALPVVGADTIVDVHGNQVALLARSRCFQQSRMTCLTCHDVHRTERDVAALSGKCLTCHQLQSCGLFPTHGQALAGKCVDCHMPLQQSSLIISARAGEEERVQVRTHWIRVYKDSSSRGSRGRS